MTDGPQRGFRLANRYRLAGLLGSGGGKRVWRAHDTVLDRSVAVKEVPVPRYASGQERAAHRSRLLGATARIDHPNVVQTHDVLEGEERLWIVMELVEGPSLADVVARAGPLSPPQTARVGRHLAAALQATHAAGVLHGCVKPGNVLLESWPDGRVVLSEFGVTPDGAAQPRTTLGVDVGAAEFMAPEQLSGDGPREAASDLWALGATLCMAVTGRSPFARASASATLDAILRGEADPADAAGPLLPVLRDLLHKDPADRLSLDELIPRLEEVAGGVIETSCEPRTSTNGAGCPVSGPQSQAETRRMPGTAQEFPDPSTGPASAAPRSHIPRTPVTAFVRRPGQPQGGPPRGPYDPGR